MDRNQATRRFSADNRAVSAVVGFILIFAILVLMLTVYQAQIVPQQNAQAEFEHFEQVSDDMVDFRSAVSSAGQSDRSQFPTVQLGTTYQTRLLTINPPPPSGTLQTSESYDIKINGDPSVPTRFLEYQPRYNELTTGSVWYENSVVYHDDQDEQVIIEDQSLVTGDERLRITALQNELDETGTDTLTVELYPTETSDIDFDELEEENGDVEITIPTRLDDHWNETLTADFDDSDFSVNNDGTYPNGVFALNITVDVENIHINTVGIRSEPNQDTARNIDQDRAAGDDDDGDDRVPPDLDEDNKETIEDNNGEFDVIERTEDSDVLFEGIDSEFLVEAGSDTAATMEGIVRFDEDDGTVTIDSSSDEIATVEEEIFMRDDSEIELLGSSDEEARAEDDISLGDAATVTADGAEITGDLSVGSDNSEIEINAESDYESIVTGSVEAGDDATVDLRGSSDELVNIQDDVVLSDGTTLTADGAEIAGDLSVGSDESEIEINAESDYESIVTGSVEAGDDATVDLRGSSDELVNIQDDVVLGDDTTLTAEGTEIEGDSFVGTESSIEIIAEEDFPSEISGDVEVGDDSDVTLEASSDEEAIIDGSLTYEGDGTVELVDSSDEESQINEQVIIEDEDSTVEFTLEDEDRFDDLEVVDGDGNELDEDDDQVEITA